MKRASIFINSILIICCFLFIVGCTSSSKDLDDYKFGIVYSSNDNNSIISTYNSTGEHIDDKKIKIGGIALASFMSFGIENDGYIYYPCPVYNNQGNDSILQLNTDNLEVSEIVSAEYITPTFFSVDNEYAYCGSSSIEETYLSRTKLDTNEVENTLEVEGQGIFCLNDEENLYVISIIHSDNNDSYGKVSIIDKSTFNILDTIDIDNLTFTSDVKIINNTMYILMTRDGRDNLSNNIIGIDLSTKNTKIINIPFDNLFKIHTQDKYMYVVEASYHRNDTKNRIAKINLDNMQIEEFVANNKHISSYILDSNFISCDGEKVYIYDIDNFNLLNEFDIKQFENQNFVSIYIND